MTHYSNFKSWLGVTFLLIVTLHSYAQTITQDVIYLKNGTILKGQIIDYNSTGQLKVEIKGGSILVYDANQVQKIDKETIETAVLTPKPADRAKIDKETAKKIKAAEPGYILPNGLRWGVGFSPHIAAQDGIGVQFDGTLWYQFHPLFSVGVGASFAMTTQWYVLPAYLSLRSYLQKTGHSFFIELNGGYSLPIDQVLPINRGVHTEKLEGGWYLRPAVGHRFKTKRKAQITLDIGFSITNFLWGYRIDALPGGTSQPYTEEVVNTFRPGVRLGILF